MVLLYDTASGAFVKCESPGIPPINIDNPTLKEDYGSWFGSCNIISKSGFYICERAEGEDPRDREQERNRITMYRLYIICHILLPYFLCILHAFRSDNQECICRVISDC